MICANQQFISVLLVYKNNLKIARPGKFNIGCHNTHIFLTENSALPVYSQVIDQRKQVRNFRVRLKFLNAHHTHGNVFESAVRGINATFGEQDTHVGAHECRVEHLGRVGAFKSYPSSSAGDSELNGRSLVFRGT